MRLRRPSREQHSETIIALIDVVFFLLVFFMLIGRLDATAPFEVVPATAQSGSDLPAGGATLSVGPDGELALDGHTVDAAEFETAIAARLGDDPDLRLRVNAHRDAPLRHVLPLVGNAEALGVADVVLVVTPSLPEAVR